MDAFREAHYSSLIAVTEHHEHTMNIMNILVGCHDATVVTGEVFDKYTAVSLFCSLLVFIQRILNMLPLFYK